MKQACEPESECSVSILSGLKGLGLGKLENMDIYEEEKKEQKEQEKPTAASAVHKIDEKDLIFDKSFVCPVCDSSFTAKIVKTGKAKLLGTDQDLRARYEGIDPAKYEVLLCPNCGYAALSRYFSGITSAQAKLIREAISQNVHINTYNNEVYSYEQAMERYKLTLVNAVVKKAKASEKAYICLKSAWLVRGYAESLREAGKNDEKLLKNLAQQEAEYLENAYKGFLDARQTENFPMCGMDEITVDYLLAALAVGNKKYDVASKLVASLLTNNAASTRIKDKARDLKEQILEDMKKQ